LDTAEILFAIDVGTTHCKAALFGQDGRLLRVASRSTPVERAPAGQAYIDPQALWQAIVDVIRELASSGLPGPLAAIGIASMAETGLLIDRNSRIARTPLIPWFDPAATSQVDRLKAAGDPQERFCRAGIRPNFKCSLAKILWLREQNPRVTVGAIWLSAADYIAFRLAGALNTDYSLAGRTLAFRLDRQTWDTEWLETFDLEGTIFPEPKPSGTPLGGVLPGVARALGLPSETPVVIAGHDHVCAAFAAGILAPGQAFNSMGTAEALVGAFPSRPLGEADYRSGLVFGCHLVPGLNYWMGGLSASGGSVEWLRGVLGDPPLSYADLDDLLAQARPGPTGILYFPYLSGSGSPHADVHLRGAFVGLDAAHGQTELAKAVLEGTAYEMEFIRRRAEQVLATPIDCMAVTGGGTRNRTWMQIKADITGCRLEVPAMPEATLLGAALVAGVGAGVYAGPTEALGAVGDRAMTVYEPEGGRHARYQRFYEQGYLALQEALRAVAGQIRSI
jgi:sugar (pentulose or hexulose) kinase